MKSKNSLEIINDGVFFPGWNKLCNIAGEVKNPNVFLRGVILRNRFSTRNFPGRIQPGYWDKMSSGCEKINNILNCITLQIILALYFRILSVALSRLVLIWNFFEETCCYHLHAYLLACFNEVHLKFLKSHIYFHIDDCELCRQYQSSSQKMMAQICNLETVEPQEIPIMVCVIFYI